MSLSVYVLNSCYNEGDMVYIVLDYTYYCMAITFIYCV